MAKGSGNVVHTSHPQPPGKGRPGRLPLGFRGSDRSCHALCPLLPGRGSEDPGVRNPCPQRTPMEVWGMCGSSEAWPWSCSRGGRQQSQAWPGSGQVQTSGVEGRRERPVPGWLWLWGGRRPRPAEQNNE